MQSSDANVNLDQSSEITRREFLSTAAAGFVGIAAIGVAGIDLFKSPVNPISRESGGVIFPDPTLCIGCLTCEVACTEVHKQQGMSSVSRIRIFNEPKTVVDPEVIRNYPDRGTFFQQDCLQCPDAPCLPVCPANALRVDPKTGARFIDEKACIACGRCAQACPFDVRSEVDAVNQLSNGQKTRIIYDPAKNVYAKCDLCYFREEGPACAERCPINIRIKQGIVKVAAGRMCLDVPKYDKDVFAKLRDMQAAGKS